MAALTLLSLWFYLFVKNSTHNDEIDFVSLFCLLALTAVGLQTVAKSHVQEFVTTAAQMMVRMEAVLEHLDQRKMASS